nr:phytoene desaturase family protein [Motilibacter peucedani]
MGAGMGGLAAAARLGALGHSVVVCEQSERAGGKVGTVSRDGFTFDTGPSLLTLPAAYRDLFLKTGGPLEDEVELQPVDPVFTYRFPDGTRLRMPNASRAAVRQAVGESLGEQAADDWEALIAHAARVWEATRGPFLEAPLTARDMVRLSRDLRALRTVAPWRSLRTVGTRRLHDPRLRMVLDRYATYTGSDPRRAPAALCVIPFMEQAFGAWHVRGGIRRLADAVCARAVQTGAELRLGTEVRRVLVEGGRAAGVELADGSRVDADVVVAGSDARELYGHLLAPDVAAAPLRRLRRAEPSLSGFVLLLALEGRTPGLTHHTVLFPADYDDEFDSVFGGRVPADPTVYVSAADDPALRPDDDSEAWFVLVNAPRHEPGTGTDWDAPGFADAYADSVLEILARRGLDVRDRLRWRVVRTPADLERETRSPGGAIYGTSSNGPRAAFLRPANRSPVPGLFLVGGSSHPGGGLPLVALSAAIVAEMVGKAERRPRAS